MLPPKSKARAMTVTDIRSKVEDEKSSPVTRIAELEKTPVLTLVDAVEPGEVECRTDPLIQALVDKLPKPETIWSLEDRAKWLRAAAIIFNLVYKPGEANEAELKIEEKTSALKSAG